MTFEWCHRKFKTFHSELDKHFSEQLKQIHPHASLCYQSQHSKFTVSLYDCANIDLPNIVKLSYSHIDILSAFEITPEVEKLAEDVNKFIQRR